MDFTGVAEFCKYLEIPYEQVDTEIARIVFQAVSYTHLTLPTILLV